jgi:aspartate aminotransferase
MNAFVGRRTPAGKVIDGDPALCEYLIEEAKVAVVPGSAFYAPGYVRLSYATSQANIEKGLGRIGDALAKLK